MDRLENSVTRNVSNYYHNKVALITGGASGIGQSLAQHIAEYGGIVVIADRDIEAAEKICSQLTDNGYKAHPQSLDVRDRQAFREFVNWSYERFGRIDLLFNNAGIAVGGPALEYTAEDWDHIVDVNLKGVIHGIEAVYPLMQKQGFGQIVNTASVVALFPNVLTVSYSATKAAVNVLSQTLRLEAQTFGIKVNVLCPGAVATPILYGGQFGRLGEGITKNMMERYWQKMKPMPVDAFAKAALIGIAQNKASIVLPRWWILAVLSYRLSPAVWLRYSNKAIQKFSKARAKSDPAAPTT